MKGLKRSEYDIIIPNKGGDKGGGGEDSMPIPDGVQQWPPTSSRSDAGKKTTSRKINSPVLSSPSSPSSPKNSEEKHSEEVSATGKITIPNVTKRGIGGMLSDKESVQLQKKLGVPIEKPPTEDEIKELVRNYQPLLKKHPGNSGTGSGRGNTIRLLPDAVARLLNTIVDWKALLKKYIGRIVGDEREAIMPNRRYASSGDYIYGSRKAKTKLKTCVIAVDVSGSIGSNELAIMINEVRGVAASKKLKYFEIVYFDDGIQHVEKMSDKEVIKYKPTVVGGGGTSFIEPLEYMNSVAKKGDLDLAIFMTDGYANLNLPIPKFKDKFIWFILDNPAFEAPWANKVVYVDVKNGKGKV